jgi:septum formation protein
MDRLLLILASASPRRQELLASAGVAFEIIPSDTDEGTREGESPEEYVTRLAREKAAEVAEKHPHRWVLAADTIVVVDGSILGKPKDPPEAREMLERLSGREHRVITGYCILHSLLGKAREGRVATRVRFKSISSKEIQWYLETGEPFDKAGAYAVQGRAAFMVREISGSYTNVVGLPLCEVVEALLELGVKESFGWQV